MLQEPMLEPINVMFCWRFLGAMAVDPHPYWGWHFILDEGMYCIAIFSCVDNITTEIGNSSGSIPTSMQIAFLK